MQDVKDAPRLTAGPGHIVEGFDLADPASWPVIHRALYDHHMIVVRGQQALTADALIAFGRSFGDPQIFPHPLDADHPEILVLSNSPDIPDADRDYALHWHNDGTYDQRASNVTLLQAIESPVIGGETLFADAVAAYAELDEAVKHRIEGLVARHEVFGGKPAADEYIPTPRGLPPSATPVLHPIVHRHPVTGRCSLHGISGTPAEIIGMDPAEADQLFAKLKAHVAAERFHSAFKAQPGDVVIWDNFAVLHRATPISYSAAEGERRRLHRISTKGPPVSP